MLAPPRRPGQYPRTGEGGAVVMMGTKVSDLPPFAFPVIAWAPEPAIGSPYDDGTREILTPRDLTTIYFPETDLRLGWTFVDAEGRSWEAVSSRVTGRADPWWTRTLPKWLHHPKYRLEVVYVERPAVPFDKVKSRLFAAVAANPQAYRGHYGPDRRRELRAAESLRDLIKSEEARAIERLKPETWWWQWLFWEGRCSRPAFVIAGAAIATAIWFDVAWRIPMPIFLVVLLVSFVFGISAVVRRLHDLGRTGWWIATWLLFNIVCAQVHDGVGDPAIKAMAVIVWAVVTIAALGFLAAAPGDRGVNRYGFASGRVRRHPATNQAGT